MTILDAMSVEQLLAEVQRRQKSLDKLLKEKARLQQKLAAIEDQIAALGADIKLGGRGRRAAAGRPAAQAAAPQPSRAARAQNKGSLLDTVLQVLQPEKAMGIPEIIAAVNQAGYVSHAKTFPTIIGQTLRQAGDKVIRVKRGMYALNG